MKQKPKPKRDEPERVSLSPLKPAQALRALLDTPPPEFAKRAKPKKK
jgi:hypothetical protein